MPQPIDHSAADVARIDEDHVRVPAISLKRDVAGQRHAVEAGPCFPCAALAVASAPDSQHRLVIAEPRAVHAEDHRIAAQPIARITLLRRLDHIERDELHRRGAGKHAAHTNLGNVAILAIGPHDLIEIRLVGALDRAAVDLLGVPELALLAEALAECARVERRVAEREPDDLCALVSQRAQRHFPDLFGNARGFVEHNDQALALVVQTGERFGVVLGPSDQIRAP